MDFHALVIPHTKILERSAFSIAFFFFSYTSMKTIDSLNESHEVILQWQLLKRIKQ